MSLTDGSSKMSKSDPADGSRINLTDSAEVISKKARIRGSALSTAAYRRGSGKRDCVFSPDRSFSVVVRAALFRASVESKGSRHELDDRLEIGSRGTEGVSPCARGFCICVLGQRSFLGRRLYLAALK